MIRQVIILALMAAAPMSLQAQNTEGAFLQEKHGPVYFVPEGALPEEGTWISQEQPELLVPAQQADAENILRAEKDRLYGPTTNLLTNTALVRSRYQELRMERANILLLSEIDPTFAERAKANNQQWDAYARLSQKTVYDLREALRRARRDPVRIRGSQAELAWLNRWGHLPEWDRLMKAWALTKEADDDATAVLAMYVPAPIVIPPPAQDNLVGSTWRGPFFTYSFEVGSNLRVTDLGPEKVQKGSGRWTRNGDQLTLQWSVQPASLSGWWVDYTFTAPVGRETLTGTLYTVLHSSYIRNPNTPPRTITLTRVGKSF